MLYIHIPFCKSRCSYCAFHSGTNLAQQSAYVDALCRELAQRKHFLPTPLLHTIYFGGGTPSTLPLDAFQQIFATIRQHFVIAPDAEITVECNPDDVTDSLIGSLATLGVNRISMGVQSMNDNELRIVNRRHTAAQVVEAIDICHHNDIHNISIDLIFGLPSQTIDSWRKTLDAALALPVTHLSAYNLSIEEDTPLERKIAQGVLAEVDEETQLEMFRLLREQTTAAGFEHYEISNFCKPGFHSHHNSRYWDGTPYLGIGAAAHSYDGTRRWWNEADTQRYINGDEVLHVEELTAEERYNEFVITALRTAKGLDLTVLRERFGDKLLKFCLSEAAPSLEHGLLRKENDRLILTPEGILVSNDVMSDLCWVD